MYAAALWSNLYKVSPAEGGNPSERLRRIQLPGCVAMLQVEIEIYRPRRLLPLIGDHWVKPFLCALGAVTVNGPNQSVRRASVLQHGGQTRFVVASHPQGKPEKDWVGGSPRSFPMTRVPYCVLVSALIWRDDT